MLNIKDVGWRTVAGDVKRAASWWIAPSGRRAQMKRLRDCRTLHDLFEFSSLIGEGSTQVEREIVGFLERARKAEPKRVCEIGTSFGGTAFLLSRGLTSATEYIGIDLFVKNRLQLRRFGRPGQRLHFLDGSSRDPAIVRRVERILGGEPLDLLFVDGDHTYEGVSGDFLSYRHLLREGGIIAFHDIQSDGRALGIESDAYVGEVPEFWGKLKASYPSEEFIGWHEQLGLGIGVITYSRDVRLPDDIGTL